MLFASYSFILGFLPIALSGYWLASKINDRVALGFLVLCSLAFYAIWNPPYVLLLIGSFTANYLFGRLITRSRKPAVWLVIGIAADLLVLGTFKYWAVVGKPATEGSWSIILPLGISFFTFTQIGYLVDCLDKRWRDLSFLDFVFFVTFFPHLIAGPIIHVREIIPQLRGMSLTSDRVIFGLAYFVIGLSKKVLLADTIAPTASNSMADLLRYVLQLYFDFSGYSDMAIGLAAMFGLKFPLNFNSPYKASSVIDYWQRWHMTLTRYLTLLLFNPMALAIARRRLSDGWLFVPLIITMAIAGIWHGAGWVFLVWGLVHAGYLVINHLWRYYKPCDLPNIVSIALTHLAVLGAMVFFHANSLDDAWSAFASLQNLGDGWLMIAIGYTIVWFMPNSQQIMQRVSIPRFQFIVVPAALINLIVIGSAVPKAFLYFQF